MTNEMINGLKRKRLQELCEEVKACRRCNLARKSINHLCGEGNPDSRLMLVAQAPGKREDEIGRMFVGPSGKVLDTLLKEAKIDRGSIYMTNLVKCHLPDNRRPRSNEIKTCSYFLNQEIEIIRPAIIVPLGHYATEHLLQKYGVSPPERFDKVYGRLIWTGDVKIYPLQHPAALLYDPTLEELMKRSYAKLGVLKQECKWYQVCPMKRYYLQGLIDERWIELYCKGDWQSCKRYQMEEQGISHPDNMLPDGTIDQDLD